MNYEAKVKEIIQQSVRLAEQREKTSCIFFEEYRRKHGLKKIADSDRRIYKNMYGSEPSEMALQKVRFWRLGHHLPKNREEAVLLARAMELSEAEREIFLKEYCLLQGTLVKKNKSELFTELLPEYLSQITEERLQQLNIASGMQQQRKCHIFYSDALDCI